MTIRDYADEPFQTPEEAEWRGPVAKRPPEKVVIEDNEEDPHHVDETIGRDE